MKVALINVKSISILYLNVRSAEYVKVSHAAALNSLSGRPTYLPIIYPCSPGR